MPKEKTKRNEQIKKMYRAGFSYIKVAAAFGLDKRTVYDIINGYRYRYVKVKDRKKSGNKLSTS